VLSVQISDPTNTLTGAGTIRFRTWVSEDHTEAGGDAADTLYVDVLTDNVSIATDDMIISAEVPAVLRSTTVPGSASRYIHVDYDLFGFGGAVGTAALDILNVKIIGYPIEREATYTDVTYRDSTGIRSIAKDDQFIDYYGKLTINANDDPNFSVEALYRDRVGASGQLFGSLIQALKMYSDKYHEGTDSIDNKYIEKDVVNGITDMIGIRRYLDSTTAPFGQTLATFVSNKDDITFLFATLNEDMRILEEGILHDAAIAKIIASNMSFSTSTNVSI
jgi:hypothetical protein